MTMVLRSVLIRGLVDFALTALVGLGVLLFFLVGKPYRRGFYCDDDSIRYPYHDSTISNAVLYVVGLSVPLIVVVSAEFSRYMVEKARSRRHADVDSNGDQALRRCFACIYRYVGIFLFGAACSQFLTDVAKYSIGRLRPHFWDICKPDVDCSDPRLAVSSRVMTSIDGLIRLSINAELTKQ
jgi:phosphatidate phosphatase